MTQRQPETPYHIVNERGQKWGYPGWSNYPPFVVYCTVNGCRAALEEIARHRGGVLVEVEQGKEEVAA